MINEQHFDSYWIPDRIGFQTEYLNSNQMRNIFVGFNSHNWLLGVFERRVNKWRVRWASGISLIGITRRYPTYPSVSSVYYEIFHNYFIWKHLISVMSDWRICNHKNILRNFRECQHTFNESLWLICGYYYISNFQKIPNNYRLFWSLFLMEVRSPTLPPAAKSRSLGLWSSVNDRWV